MNFELFLGLITDKFRVACSASIFKKTLLNSNFVNFFENVFVKFLQTQTCSKRWGMRRAGIWREIPTSKRITATRASKTTTSWVEEEMTEAAVEEEEHRRLSRMIIYKQRRIKATVLLLISLLFARQWILSTYDVFFWISINIQK